MTQGDIVRATGLERGYVSNLESGKIRHPRIETVAKVASAFGMRLSEFITYWEEQLSEPMVPLAKRDEGPSSA